MNVNKNLPNQLTIFRVILVPFFVAALLFEDGENTAFRILALVIFIVASLTDLFDGKIARKYGLVSTFGKFMDPLADKMLVCSALICLSWLRELSAWVTIIVVSRDFIISGFRLVAAEKGTVIAASMWGKVKTTVQMVAIIALLLHIDSDAWNVICTVLVVLMTVLTIVSLADYLLKNRDVLKEEM